MLIFLLDALYVMKTKINHIHIIAKINPILKYKEVFVLKITSHVEPAWTVWASEIELCHLLVEHLKQSSVSELYFTPLENEGNNLRLPLI